MIKLPSTLFANGNEPEFCNKCEEYFTKLSSCKCVKNTATLEDIENAVKKIKQQNDNEND